MKKTNKREEELLKVILDSVEELNKTTRCKAKYYIEEDNHEIVVYTGILAEMDLLDTGEIRYVENENGKLQPNEPSIKQWCKMADLVWKE